MKLQRLTLQNFMRYEQATIELHPGFNAIVGQSDAGKTTIERAIIWVFYNRPLGMEMCREGSEETQVTLTTDNGHTVTRLRSKKRNAYILDGVAYDNVKTEVPAEVQAALGVHLAEIGPKNFEMLGVSKQLDGPFMLTGSPSDSAKILGNLSGITTIDAGLASLKPDVASTRRAVDALEKLEQTYAVAIQEYATLPKEAEALQRARSTLMQAQNLQAKIEGLRTLQSRVESYNSLIGSIDADLQQAQAPLAAQPQALQAERLWERVQSLRGILWRMERLNADWRNVAAQLTATTEELTHLEQTFKTTLHAAGRCPLCGQAT